MAKPTVDFGYTQVLPAEKTERVGEVFRSVAQHYDLMNDLMSFGVHRYWKRAAIRQLQVYGGARVLDIAAGTGDLTLLLNQQWGKRIVQTMTDINQAMLSIGRDRLLDRGITHIPCVQADAEHLPFPTKSYDRVIIGFGLRNVTDKMAAMRDMYRVLKPGGLLLVLEFSKPVLPWLEKAYDQYSFSVLPWLGEHVLKDADSYRYLAESIRQHPDQDTLKNMMQDAGFEDCAYRNLTAGIVSLHWGRRYS